VKTKALVLSACLALLCSCSTAPNWSANDSARPPLPAAVPINKGAGDDDFLYVTLRLESGQKLLFFVDTGMPYTVLDKSLESKLGERLGTSKGNYSWYGKATAGVYAAPKLYLGDTQLLINDWILTDDLNKMSSSGEQVMGILGLDCLRHYCIQLDFDAGKMRFLDPDNLATNNLGKAFPINISYGEVLTYANFFGLKNAQLVVDTGCTVDAALKPKFVQQELQRQTAVATNEIKTAAGVPIRAVYFDKIVFDKKVYRHFILDDCPDNNLLGLRFMGRYLTTLNFPKQTMYLKPNAVEY
jgi:predicted aspartyl protease